MSRTWSIDSRWLLLVLLVVLVPAALVPRVVHAASHPNILWITCEDLSPHLGCYGDRFAHTPNLDRFARQAVRYTRAFAMASVCTPARSTLITGVYASSLGTQNLRAPEPLPPEVLPFTVYLREAGYYCSNNVKEDYNFPKPPGTWDESSNTAHWRKRPGKQPFFSVFNLMTTHQSRIRFPQEKVDALARSVGVSVRHDPARVPLPPYYPDTPVVRRDVARLYDLVSIMDAQVEQLLQQLEEDGLADETIVFFYSDHGDGMPRGKRWILDSGTRVPLLIRFPEKYRHLAPSPPGTTCSRLVSFVDFAPTVLSLAGIPIPSTMQGRAFLGPQSAEPRQYVFAIRDRVDEVYEVSRAVRDSRWRYVRNFMPHRPRMQYSTYSEMTATRQELRRLAAEGKLTGPAAELLRGTKPAEELYDTQNDPFEVHNLARVPEYRGHLERLRGVLHQWMVDTRDTGLLPEADMHRRARGRSPYIMARDRKRYPLEQILEVAELVGAGSACRTRLLEAADRSDPAIRFWAVTGLMASGLDSASEESFQCFERALADESPNVRIVAAEALCRCGRREQSLPVLLELLDDDDPRVRLAAASTLAAIADRVPLPVATLKQVIARHQQRGDFPMYIRWALERALAQQHIAR